MNIFFSFDVNYNLIEMTIFQSMKVGVADPFKSLTNLLCVLLQKFQPFCNFNFFTKIHQLLIYI